MTPGIYLDHAATAPLHPAVAEAMRPWLGDCFGNPSALYRLGREAAAALEQARTDVADVLSCRPAEVIFTSGGSESINAAIKGIAFAQHLAGLGSHLIVSAVEHHAVLHSCQYLEAFGFETSYVPVDASGLVEPEAVGRAIRRDTVLVSIMHANNEVGAVQPVGEIVRAVRARAAALGGAVAVHTDAVQSPPWLPLDTGMLGVDALSLAAHKFGGPTGAGVLFLRRGVPFLAQQNGGGQERQRRAGTEHVAGVVGAALALRLAQDGRAQRCAEVAALRGRLEDGIAARVPDSVVNGHRERRLPGILNVSFPGAGGEQLVAELDSREIAASSGSACASQSWEPSHVLLAMGLPLELAAGGVRFSLGAETTAAEIDEALARIPDAVAAARLVPVT